MYWQISDKTLSSLLGFFVVFPQTLFATVSKRVGVERFTTVTFGTYLGTEVTEVWRVFRFSEEKAAVPDRLTGENDSTN